MAELAINDGFIDCPKLGVMDEWRCLASCEYQTAKDEDKVTCWFGEEQPPEPADAEAKRAEKEA